MTRARRKRAYSLLEAMVAASMGVVILLGATNLATMMVRAARTAGDSQTLTTRAQLARGLLQPLLGALGDAWLVDDGRGGVPSGAPGEAHCVASTNVCAAPTANVVLPLRLVDGGASAPDELVALVPRPGSLESVEIIARGNGSALPNDCTTLSSTTTLDVRGVTSVPWPAGTLVLVTKQDHVTVARVAAVTFPADTTTPPATRDLTLDLGPPADLAVDDGGRGSGGVALAAEACSAFQSLRNARVMPLSQLRIRLVDSVLQIAESRTASQAANPTFVDALARVDDLQFRLEFARIPRDGDGGAASLCTCNNADILAGQKTFADGACTCVGTERPNRDGTVAPVHRLTGIEVGVLIRGEVAGAGPAAAVAGMFNRTGAGAPDAFRRHQTTMYIGLPNAHAL
jgi:hypothetical protein